MCANSRAPTRTVVPAEARSAVQAAGKSIAELTGTGMFVVPDPRAGADRVTVHIVPKLTLAECRLRGMYCLGSKWVPDLFHSYDDLVARRTAIDCAEDVCIDPPDGVCESWECICIDTWFQECA